MVISKQDNYIKRHLSVESILIIAFYCFIALSSINNIGVYSVVGFLLLVAACSFLKPRTGFIILLSIFYLPTYQLGLPIPFIIATMLVALINLKSILKGVGYRVNKTLIVLYCLFLVFRFISVIYVDNTDAFWTYFFTSFSVFIHILIISVLINDEEDVFYILRMWGVIGAFASVLGYLHFVLQDSVYLRQIFVASGDYDKSTIDGSFDFVRWIWAGVEPNFMGLQLLMPFAINIFFLLKQKSILNATLSIITFMGILGTYSRSSFLFALLILVSYIILSGSLRNKILFFVLIITGGVLLIGLFSDFVERIDSITEALNDNDASGRFPLYKEAIKNFFSNPVFGIGTGQTASHSAFKLESHNLFLQTLGENGLLGFFILISIYYNYIKKSYVIKPVVPLFLIAGIAVFFNANTVSFFDMRTFVSLFVLLNFYMYFNTGKKCKSLLS